MPCSHFNRSKIEVVISDMRFRYPTKRLFDYMKTRYACKPCNDNVTKKVCMLKLPRWHLNSPNKIFRRKESLGLRTTSGDHGGSLIRFFIDHHFKSWFLPLDLLSSRWTTFTIVHYYAYGRHIPYVIQTTIQTCLLK